MNARWQRRLRRLLTVLLSGCALALLVHLGIGWWCRITPPPLQLSRPELIKVNPELRRVGNSYVRVRNGLFEVHLTGSPEEIGFSHVRLLREEMVENEGILLGHFEKAVPNWLLRKLLLDIAQIGYRHVSDQMSAARRREIAAGALAFQPDPFAHFFPTYQRFAYLNALYDISLSFEQSPLIGCTTFVFSAGAAPQGGSILARNFDFEVDPIFDQKKAVFFVQETGKIPFASVAWPGLVGVVSGINAEGVALVVHGGRAGATKTQGVPVVHALRDVLSRARTTREALAVLKQAPALVSHIVIITDASGDAVKVERAPDVSDTALPLGNAAAVTNHFSGPLAADPKNITVREKTSTLAREARGKELVNDVLRPVTPEAAVALLRDRQGSGGQALPLGDRNAIDALIATHGVVLNTAERTLWVSLAPHLLNHFVAFDLRKAFSETAESPAQVLPSIAQDSLLIENEAREKKQEQLR